MRESNILKYKFLSVSIDEPLNNNFLILVRILLFFYKNITRESKSENH